MISLLNVARPIAMKALTNPKILGSLLVGAVGSQQANEIQNQLSLGNISLDDVYDTLINFAASPAVSALRDTPSGQASAPDEAQIEAERKFNEELNRRVTLPSEISIDQILSTPPTTTVPEPLITPDVPEEKTKVEDVGFTEADAVKLEDMIMTAKNPEDLFKDERFQEVLKMAKGDPNVDYRAQDKKDGDYIMEAPQGNTFWTTAGFPGDKMNPAKSVIIYVKPGDYLNLAKKKEDGYNEASFELYKNTNVGISVPKLLMNENEGGYFSVTGHEGRHRAKYFESLDPDTPIPVQVQLTNKGSDEYVDYTKGYYTHGQSVLNAGKKLEELGFAQNENGGLTKFKIFGYQGDGQKVGEIFEKNLDKLNKDLSNIKVSDQIADLEDYQYGNIGTRGFTEEVAQEIYQAKGYDDYQKKIQEIVRDNLGDTFTVYRGTTTDELEMEAGEPITRSGVSVTLNPQEAENFVSGKLSLPKKTGDPVLLKITATPEMIVMRGADSGELVLDGYSLNKSNMEIIPISDITSTNEKDLTTVRQGTEKEGSVIGTQEETSKAEQELLQGRLPSDQGTDVLRTEEGEKLASDALRNFFSKVLTKQTGEPKSIYKNILDISSIGQTSDIFDTKRIGNFENHIFTSIPTFKEAQIATADAVAKSLPENASILDIGGTEGGFVNTVAELRPDIEGIVLDPNPIAEKIFESQKLSNTDYIRQAFTTDKSKYGKYAFDIEDENEEGVSANYWNADDYEDNSLDAVIEKMTFQFIDRGRNNKVKLVSEKLKPNGFALFEEKFFTSNDDPEWLANEAKKNEFKLQYYDQKDLTKKQKEVLEGMDELQVPSEDFEKILMKHFNNVAQYWDAGNFKGYIASDSADTINNFLGNMKNLDSEFSNVQTPRFVTKTIDKKRRGGPISLPKIDML